MLNMLVQCGIIYSGTTIQVILVEFLMVLMLWSSWKRSYTNTDSVAYMYYYASSFLYI